jgi:hypothetical protein
VWRRTDEPLKPFLSSVNICTHTFNLVWFGLVWFFFLFFFLGRDSAACVSCVVSADGTNAVGAAMRAVCALRVTLQAVAANRLKGRACLCKDALGVALFFFDEVLRSATFFVDDERPQTYPDSMGARHKFNYNDDGENASR